MKSKKTILIVLSLMLAACLSAVALAESTAETPAADTQTAADAAKSAADAAQAAADAASAENTALSEALEAYGKAKAETRKLAVLTSLKEELDSYVTAGTLTQEQADLILKYYAEQMTLQQNSMGFGHGGKGGRGSKGSGRGLTDGISGATPGNNISNQIPGFGRGGRHGGFGGNMQQQAPQQNPQEQAPQQAPEAPADPNGNNT